MRVVIKYSKYICCKILDVEGLIVYWTHYRVPEENIILLMSVVPNCIKDRLLIPNNGRITKNNLGTVPRVEHNNCYIFKHLHINCSLSVFIN